MSRFQEAVFQKALPVFPVGSWWSAVASWVKNSVSPATWARYSAVWGDWLHLEHMVGCLRSDEERRDGVLWLVWEWHSRGVSVAPISGKVSDLAFGFKLRGWTDCTKDFVVRLALRGLRRGKTVFDSKRLVSYHLLEDLVGVLPGVYSDRYEALLFGAEFSLAFFGALRIGELVSASKQRLGGIQIGDVHLGSGSLEFRIRRSKTDLLGAGVWVSLFGVPGPSVCPVSCVHRYLEVRPGLGSSLLGHSDGVVLTRFQFLAVFKRCLSVLHVPIGDFGGHSFRIGAATEAAQLGLGSESIMRIGRWDSRRFQSYVRPHRVLGV
ncbi:integrase/recombinase xerD homolog [Rhinophrynus dorsalis]